MFSTIALIGMTIERKVTSSSTNASPSTNANTIGACDFIESLKSREPAVAARDVRLARPARVRSWPG